jgi:hypothetical protein
MFKIYKYMYHYITLVSVRLDFTFNREIHNM